MREVKYRKIQTEVLGEAVVLTVEITIIIITVVSLSRL